MGGKGSRRVNPIRLIDSIYEWQTGTSLVPALAISVFFVVGAVTFMGPLILAGAAIVAFGLSREPNSWIGSALLVAGFVGGVVATALTWRWLFRRTRPFLAMSSLQDDASLGVGVPSPILDDPPAGQPTSPSKLRELDARLAPSEAVVSTDISAPAAPSEGVERPSRP